MGVARADFGVIILDVVSPLRRPPPDLHVWRQFHFALARALTLRCRNRGSTACTGEARKAIQRLRHFAGWARTGAVRNLRRDSAPAISQLVADGAGVCTRIPQRTDCANSAGRSRLRERAYSSGRKIAGVAICCVIRPVSRADLDVGSDDSLIDDSLIDDSLIDDSLIDDSLIDDSLIDDSLIDDS